MPEWSECVSNYFQRNVSFLLRPESGCQKKDDILVMVSSGPLNQANRDRWRRDVEGRVGVRLVFLVAMARTFEDQKILQNEHEKH